MPLLRNITLRWGLKAGFSVADQGMASGANFILNILLVRWLSPSEYGAFAIAYSVFLFLSGFHNALILEPMSVIGPSCYGNHLRAYVGTTVWIHGALTIGIGVALALLGVVMIIKGSSIGYSLLGLGIASPFILLYWLFRRACYLETRPSLAFRGSASYAFILFLCLFVMWKSDEISPFNAFLAMAFSSASVSLVLWRLLRINAGVSLNRVNPRVTRIISQHWKYGKWVTGSAFVYWLSSTVYLPLIGAFAGLSQAGAFRAMQNLFLPLQQSLTALALLVLPWSARQVTIHGRAFLRTNLPKIIAVGTSFALCYITILVISAQPLVALIYKRNFYDQFLWLIPYFSVAAIIGTMSHGLSIALKALRRPDSVFIAQAGSAFLTLTIGIYLVSKSGLLGAVMGIILNLSVATIILFILLSVLLRKR